MTLYLMCSLVASTTSIRAPLYPITLDSLRSYSTSLLKAEQPAIQVLPPLARADEPLSANMSETATPRKFSVEGEQGLEDDERTGTSPRWTGDRGDGVAGNAAGHRDLVMATVTQIGPRLGIAPTCAALGLPRATYYRRRRPSRAAPPRRPSPRALSAGERGAVLALLHEPRFVDHA